MQNSIPVSNVPSTSVTNSSMAPIKLMTLNVPLVHKQLTNSCSSTNNSIPGTRLVQVAKISNNSNGPITQGNSLEQIPGSFLFQIPNGKFQVIRVANPSISEIPATSFPLQNQSQSQKWVLQIAQGKQNGSQTIQALTSSLINGQSVILNSAPGAVSSNNQIKLQQPTIFKTIKVNSDGLSKANQSILQPGNTIQTINLKTPNSTLLVSPCQPDNSVQIYKNVTSIPVAQKNAGQLLSSNNNSSLYIDASSKSDSKPSVENCKINSVTRPVDISLPDITNTERSKNVTAINAASLQGFKETSKQNGTKFTPSVNEPSIKCCNFLRNLIKLASQQPSEIKNTVITLVQSLIDNQIYPDEFVSKLEKCLSSAPQPSLAPFLRSSLPYVRQAMANGTVILEGIHSPSLHSLLTQDNKNATPKLLQVVQVQPSARFKSAQFQIPSQSPVLLQNISQSPAPLTPVIGISSSRLPYIQNQNQFIIKTESPVLNINYSPVINNIQNNAILYADTHKESLLKNEMIFSQPASEFFLLMDGLQKRILVITQKYDLKIAENVAKFVSAAVKHRLSDLLEKVTVAVDHRMDDMRFNPQYKITQDIKGQLTFLADIDRLKKKRQQEAEHQLLSWAAKTRSNLSQSDLKERAKEWQRTKAEQSLFEDANNTALLAIGSRKKQKTNTGFSSLLSRSRIKRVNIRDLIFVLEREKKVDKTWLHNVYLK